MERESPPAADSGTEPTEPKESSPDKFDVSGCLLGDNGTEYDDIECAAEATDNWALSHSTSLFGFIEA
ncbi:MAG: hypothetical protein ACREBR_01890, partial [bacterium]